MNRFAIFCGTYNLLMGGAKDFKESHPTKEAALKRAKEIAKTETFVRWVQIFDKATDKYTVYVIVDGELKEEGASMGEEIKLKDCPLCGAKAVFASDDHSWRWIECTGCSASTGGRVSCAGDYKPLLAKKWNSRVGGAEAKGNG